MASCNGTRPRRPSSSSARRTQGTYRGAGRPGTGSRTTSIRVCGATAAATVPARSRIDTASGEPDVVDAAGRPSQQHRPQPNREVRGVEIGPHRRTVARDAYRLAGEDVAQEIPDRVPFIERKVRTDEREQPRDHRTDAEHAGVGCARELGCAFALAVFGPGLGRAGGAVMSPGTFARSGGWRRRPRRSW